MSGRADSGSTRVVQRLRTHRFVIIAFSMILVQLAVVELLLPNEERWFLHPDDHETFRLARQIAETGSPASPVPTPYGIESDGFIPPLDVAVDGRVASHRAPGLSYLLAPGADHSFGAAMAIMTLLAALTGVAFYLLAARLFGPIAALWGLAAFLFSPPVMFWSAFFFANLPGLGLLLTSLYLLSFRRPILQAAGMGILVLSMSLRYDYIIFVGIIGVGWLLSRRRELIKLQRSVLLPIAAGSVAFCLFLTGVYFLYGTVNFVAISTGNAAPEDLIARQDAPVDALGRIIAFTFGTVEGENLRHNVTQFGIPIFAALSPAIALCVLRKERTSWVFASFGAATAVAVYFFLGNQFHPVKYALFGSVSRYTLPAVALGALCLGRLVVEFQYLQVSKFWKIGAPVLVVGMLVLSGTTYAGSSEGFGSAREYLDGVRAMRDQAEQLPPNPVFVGEHLAKVLTDFPVLAPSQFPVNRAQSETLQVTEMLLERGARVYISSTHNGEYRVWFKESANFELHQLSTPAYLEVVLKEGHHEPSQSGRAAR